MRALRSLLDPLLGYGTSRRDLLASLAASSVFGRWLAAPGAAPRWGSRGARLAGVGPDDRFGGALALDGDTAIVGAAGAETTAAAPTGAAFLFTRTGAGWTRAATLAPGPDGDRFGASVALDGGTALVADPLGWSGDGPPAGSVGVFERGDGDWTRTATLAPAAPTGVDRFGSALALDGDTAVVVASTAQERAGTTAPAGVAHLFTRRDGGWRWAGAQPAGERGPPRRATAAAVDGTGALVGGQPVDVPDGSHGGTVQVIER